MNALLLALTLTCTTKHIVRDVNANPNLVAPKLVVSSVISEQVSDHALPDDIPHYYAMFSSHDEKNSGYIFTAGLDEFKQLTIYSTLATTKKQAPQTSLTAVLNNPVRVSVIHQGDVITLNDEKVNLYQTTFECVVTE